MDFSAEQIHEIENLSGLNYSVRKIAMYLDIPVRELEKEYENLESKFRYHYERGQLLNQALIDNKLVENAKGGNITATQIYMKQAKENKLNNLKYELFGI